MEPDYFTHKSHAERVELVESTVSDHPVLDSATVHRCPESNCSYREVESFEIDHDHSLSFDLEERLDSLLATIDLPVYHTYHCSGGMREGRKAFPTQTEAKAYIFGRYGKGSSRPGPGAVRKTRSLSHGIHTQTVEAKSSPMVFSIVNTRTGRTVGSNLVPRERDVPDSAPHWQRSVTELVNKHLSPRPYLVERYLGVTDWKVPDDYEHDALAWHVEQIQHWDIVVQTPQLLLDEDKHTRAINLVAEYEPASNAPPL